MPRSFTDLSTPKIVNSTGFAGSATESVCLWVLNPGVGSTTNRTLFSKNFAPACDLNQYGGGGGVSGAGKVVFGRSFSTTDGIWSIASPGSWTVWKHLAWTYDGSSTSNNPSIFVNGVSQTVTKDRSPVGTVDTSSSVMTIGQKAGGTANSCGGTLAYVSYYNVKLTASEVLEAMLYGWTPRGLVALFPLWGDSTEPDISGNKRNGTVTGTTVVGGGPPVAPYFINPPPQWPVYVTSTDATVAGVAMSANASMPAAVPGVAVQLAGMVANASMPVDIPKVTVIAAPPTATAIMTAPVPSVALPLVAMRADASMPAAVPNVRVLPGAFSASASMTAGTTRTDAIVSAVAMSARAGADLPYVTKVLTYNPAVFWYANEYTGTTLEDHSGNNRPGTINGSDVTYRAQWLTNSIQSLGYSPSAGTPILASRSYSDTTNAFSAIVWGTIPDVGASSGEVELLAHDDSDSFGWWIWYSPGSLPTVIQFQMVDHNGVNHTLTYDFLARAALEDPHMYGITFDGTNMTLYVDGANVATRTTTWDAASANANNLLVGRTSGGQQCKVGMAAFIRNTVLSDADMAALYTEGTKALSLVNQDTPEVRLLPGAFTANATMTPPSGSFSNVIIFPPAMTANASMPTPSMSASNDPTGSTRGEFLLWRRRRRVVQ